MENGGKKMVVMGMLKEVMLVLSVVLQCWDHFFPDSDLKTMISLVVSDMLAK